MILRRSKEDCGGDTNVTTTVTAILAGQDKNHNNNKSATLASSDSSSSPPITPMMMMPQQQQQNHQNNNDGNHSCSNSTAASTHNTTATVTQSSPQPCQSCSSSPPKGEVIPKLIKNDNNNNNKQRRSGGNGFFSTFRSNDNNSNNNNIVSSTSTTMTTTTTSPKNRRRRFPLLLSRNRGGGGSGASSSSSSSPLRQERRTGKNRHPKEDATTTTAATNSLRNNHQDDAPPESATATTTTTDLVLETCVFSVREQQQQQQRISSKREKEPPPPPPHVVSPESNPKNMNAKQHQHDEHDDDDETSNDMATAILQHSYLERLCCAPHDYYHSTEKGAVVSSAVRNHLQAEEEDNEALQEQEEHHGANESSRTSLSSSSLSSSSKSVMHSRMMILPDDPTVQESIECVFAYQLRQGLPMLLLRDDDDDDDDYDDDGMEYKFQSDAASVHLVAPSVLQQSLLPIRSDSGLGNNNGKAAVPSSAAAVEKKSLLLPAKSKSPTTKWHHESLRLVHVGTFDPQGDGNNEIASPKSTSDPLVLSENNVSAGWQADAACRADTNSGLQCACFTQKTPIVGMERWPQRPLLLRPTPGSGTRVVGIRRVRDRGGDYLWEASKSNLSWPGELHKRAGWGSSSSASANNNATSNRDVGRNEDDAAINPMEVMCPHCMIMPINNGNEAPGQTLVTDFESDLFEGTLLLRIRHSSGTTPEPFDDDKGYFKGVNRRYQAVIRGRFKSAIPLTACTTGFVLDRPCGKLPAKWVVKGSLKVLSFFAPQLEARLDGDHPSSLTPLGSTPQVLAVHDDVDDIDKFDPLNDLEAPQEEPTERRHSLLGETSDAASSLQRARFRKKAFDKLFTQHATDPLTDPRKVYTFEFLQHLVNFHEFQIELGSMLGSVPLPPVLDGQPLQIMAQLGGGRVGGDYANMPQRLWSFDVWHEDLLADANRHDAASKERA